LYDVLKSGAAGILGCMDELQFYNIIEIEKPKGLDAKRDVKQCKFWLKVEFQELQRELKTLNDELNGDSIFPKE
jgi:hypothetical protein